MRDGADNNIGRNCYRIGQIQRTFSASLRALEVEGRRRVDALATAAAAQGDAPSVATVPDVADAGGPTATPAVACACVEGAGLRLPAADALESCGALATVGDLRAAGLDLIRAILAQAEASDMPPGQAVGVAGPTQ